MEIRTCKYVNSSELLNGFDAAFVELFQESITNDISWGDANKTLCDISFLLNKFEYSDEPVNEDERNINILVTRLNTLPDDCYIDLEN